MTNGTVAYSHQNEQFALFGFNAPGPLAPFASGDSWIVGIEDIDYFGDSDRDYNDILFKITRGGPDTPQETVPEPATMTLLATGLLGMGAARRKKRRS